MNPPEPVTSPITIEVAVFCKTYDSAPMRDRKKKITLKE